MLSEIQIQQEAQLLRESEKNKRQISATTTRYPDMTMADAYAVQKAGIALKLTEGRKIVGHKIGLTSRTMQRSMNINSSIISNTSLMERPPLDSSETITVSPWETLSNNSVILLFSTDFLEDISTERRSLQSIH